MSVIQCPLLFLGAMVFGVDYRIYLDMIILGNNTEMVYRFLLPVSFARQLNTVQ